MNPLPKDQFTGTNVLESIMNKVSAAIEKRYETPMTKVHKEWNAVIEEKRKQKLAKRSTKKEK